MTATAHEAGTIRRSGSLPTGALAVKVSGTGTDLLRLRLDGELDAATARLVRAMVGPLLRDAPRAVGIDLRGLSFIDLSGLRAVEAVLERAEDAGCRITVHPPERCAQIAARLVRVAAQAHGATVLAVPASVRRLRRR